MLAWSTLLSQYPTQLYYSVLPFLPSDTYLARHYPTHTSGISILRGRDRSWSPLLFTLRANSWYPGITFAPKGQVVALASLSRLDLFDARSGLPLSSIVGPERTGSYLPHVCGATFNADASEVIVARSQTLQHGYAHCDVVKYNVTRQIGWVHRWALGKYAKFQLSEGGSYVAFDDSTGLSGRGIRIWRTDGGDDIFIMMMTHDIRDLSLSADPAHLVAIATNNTIIVLDVLSGNTLQTLRDEDGSFRISISPDGSFLASVSRFTTRLWSTTQGTLLHTFGTNLGDILVFSLPNRLYMARHSGGGSVCDVLRLFHSGDGSVRNVLAEHDRSVIEPFPFPARIGRVALTPNDTQIAIWAFHDTQVWSLKHFRDAHVDSGPHSILDIDLSSDASLLAIGTETTIEVWDVRIVQCCYVIQSKSTRSDQRSIHFSPRGELIVSDSRDGTIVIDVQMGIIRPTIYSAGGHANNHYRQFGISFDDSTLAALNWEGCIHLWDLPSGVLLHTIDDLQIKSAGFEWSRRDLYLMGSDWVGTHSYFNAKTFQEEHLSDPGDRFEEHGPLRGEGNMLRTRSPHGRKGHLFLALPSHLKINIFHCRGDRVTVLSNEGQLLVLDISGLDAYMKEFCAMESEPEGELGVYLLKFPITIQSCRREHR